MNLYGPEKIALVFALLVVLYGCVEKVVGG